MEHLFLVALVIFAFVTVTAAILFDHDQLGNLWYDLGDSLGDLAHRIRSRYVQTVASLIARHISTLQTKARAAGEEDGYRRGYEEGKNVWDISGTVVFPDERRLDESIYGPQLFKVTGALCDRMRQEVAAAVERKVVRAPTPEQWAMILSSHPATCVLAGAGSGKSTTLVLRIIFMLAHLGIRPEEMTVVSFTNDSCADLREKLIDLASHWKLPIDPAVAKSIVRTFHSALYRMGQVVFPGVEWFENIGRTKNTATDIDSPYASSINEDQVDLITPTYRRLFKNDSVFRRSVLAMLQIECERDAASQEKGNSYAEKDWIIRIASERDRALVDLTNARWSQHGLWPMEGIDPTPFEVFRVGEFPFYANGRVVSSSLPIFLGAGTQEDRLFDSSDTVSTDKDRFPATGAIGVKRNIVSWRFGREYVYLRSKAAIPSLELRIKYLEAPCATDDAPMFDVRLSGEKGRVALLEAFIAQASFIESMGLEVADFVRDMRAFREPDIDHHFCTALARFWPSLEQDLWRKKVITFNRGFRRLSDTLIEPKERQSLAPECRPLTHLLIDEFQDISSQIVTWISNAQRLLSVNNKRPTIMAIGDDWQSIYGWRGSSPEYFIQFQRFFRVHSELGRANVCHMGENFRSIPEIVEDGTEVLLPVAVRTQKQVCSNVSKDPGDHGVKITVQGDMSDDDYANVIVDVINQQYALMVKRPNGDKRKVLVIGRTNSVVDDIEKRAGAKPGLSYRTIHRSKGLQAEVAIICDDCTHEGPHPIRDRVYALMDGFECKSYEDAQRDEALRLAYVAVTRGIRRVYWFAGKGDGAAKTLSANSTQRKPTLVVAAEV